MVDDLRAFGVIGFLAMIPISALAAGWGFVLGVRAWNERVEADRQRKWGLAVVPVALAYMLFTTAILVVLLMLVEYAFQYLQLISIQDALIAGGGVAAFTLWIVNDVMKINAGRLLLLVVVILSGGIYLTITNIEDPLWWRVSFSYLGKLESNVNFMFNFTLVFAGILLLVWLGYFMSDFRILVRHGVAAERWAKWVRIGLIWLAIAIMPVSIALLITSAAGAGLMVRFSPRRIVRIALLVLLLAIFILLSNIEPTLQQWDFGVAMALLGFGIGLLAAVLGNLIQSAVVERERSEAGGLQNTATQLGTALGTAVIGAVLISGLSASFSSQIVNDDRLPAEIVEAAETDLARGVTFLSAAEVRSIVDQTDLEPDIADAMVENYAESQLHALKTALLATLFIVLISLAMTRKLPTTLLDEIAAGGEPATPTNVEEAVG